MSKLEIITKIVQSLFILIGLFFFTGVLLLTLTLQGALYLVWFIVTVAICSYIFFILLLFNFFKTKKRKQYFAVTISVVITISSISPIYHLYSESIPTVDAEVDVFQYEPFKNNQKIKIPDTEPSLKMTDPLPKLDGATAMYPLYSAFVQATYPEKEYGPYNSEVMVNTTPIAYENLFNGDVDLIFAAAPSESQMRTAEMKGLTLEMTPIGREAFVFFVHHKNAINNLTLDQVKQIYAGEITNWKEVGGKNDNIRAFQRPPDSGSQSTLEKIMGNTPIMEAPTENVATGMGGIINEVSKYKNYKNAIGYTFRFYSTEMVGNDTIKLLSINGVAPTKETIRTGDYPMSSEFYAITAGSDNPNVQKFIDWIVSDEGQAIVEKVGYIPVNN